MALNILVVGAGVCGPTFATLLQRSNPAHNITVIERASTLRASGLQLDFKAQGTPIMQKMGLLEEMERKRVNEVGAEVIGRKGEVLARYGVLGDSVSDGSGAFTRELEIMRGDMVKVLYDTSLADRKRFIDQGIKEGDLKYEFGITVKDLVKHPDGVDITFSDGRQRHFDLIVGADGQNSTTRTLAFGREASNASIKELNSQVCYFTIPRGPYDGHAAKMYFAPGSRAILLRNGDRPLTQIYLLTTANNPDLKASLGKSVAEQKAAWTEMFKDVGWEIERFLSGMHDASDFYAQDLIQIKLPSLYTSRVVLLGDAGYCPAVVTGNGTTSSFIGAYVLAGELARHGSDVDAALKQYDEVMKEPVNLAQVIGSQMNLPQSEWALWFLQTGIWAASATGIDRLMMRVMPKRKEEGLGTWVLPEYPELKLKE